MGLLIPGSWVQVPRWAFHSFFFPSFSVADHHGISSSGNRKGTQLTASLSKTTRRKKRKKTNEKTKLRMKRKSVWNDAVTRIRTWVIAATTRGTNHYTITANPPTYAPPSVRPHIAPVSAATSDRMGISWTSHSFPAPVMLRTPYAYPSNTAD